MLGIDNLFKEFENLKNKKIITITLNPVIDRTLWIPDFKPGQTMIIEDVKILAAGKGVNVSRALKMLNIPSIATGILPENGSEFYLSLLKKESINSDFLIAETTDMVRNNITIISNNTDKETHLREKGSTINRDILDNFINKLKTLSKEADALVFSGSLPAGLPENTYELLIKNMKSPNKIIALDSSGSALKYGIKSSPTLIKPNDKESKEIVGFKADNNKNIIKAVKIFSKLGILYTILSLGEKGVVYSNGNIIVKAYVKLDNLINSVGSGDAALAGGLAAIMANIPPQEIAAFSCAMGAANTLSYGACIIDQSKLEEIYKKINLEIL